MSWLTLPDALFILLNFYEDRRLSTPFFFSRIDMNVEVRSMAKIMVYDPDTNQIYTEWRAENDPMPYSYGRTLLVREFRGSSRLRV